ncbi:hypothetical protein STPYR_12830 [uncultured Stenotrophomonas sp.]|uniref:Uncharacterized protein n=1 Tax=uncultured Stenotrophomonas sp. TaxID=165438 RepID=A0A1Y5QBQ5_9GAMM|nr:hypothetical protein STPYR_12830 [uncultured Stenotrophomonas sp.]
MNFDALQRRVRRAEAVVQVRMDDTSGHWNTLDARWRRSWTPGRIVIAGLAGGFLAGKLEPGETGLRGAAPAIAGRAGGNCRAASWNPAAPSVARAGCR